MKSRLNKLHLLCKSSKQDTEWWNIKIITWTICATFLHFHSHMVMIWKIRMYACTKKNSEWNGLINIHMCTDLFCNMCIICVFHPKTVKYLHQWKLSDSVIFRHISFSKRYWCKNFLLVKLFVFFSENIKADIDELGIKYILQLPDDRKIYPLIAKQCT